MADDRTEIKEAVFWALQRVMEDHDLAKLTVDFDCHNFDDPDFNPETEFCPATVMSHTLTVWSEPLEDDESPPSNKEGT